MSNRLLYFCLFLSLVAHFFLLNPFSIPKEKYLQKSSSLEVTYQEIKTKEIKKKSIEFKDLKILKKKEKIKPRIKILSRHKSQILDIGDSIKDISKLSKPFSFEKKRLTGLHPVMDISKKISIPVIEIEKGASSMYLEYKEKLSLQIQRFLETLMGSQNSGKGRVCLSFIMSADGILKQIRIVEDETQADQFLRSVALRGVKSSSPFPPYSTDENLSEITFTITIFFN
jgi:hypothetical protein